MSLIEWMPMILSLIAGVTVWVFFKIISKQDENSEHLTNYSSGRLCRR